MKKQISNTLSYLLPSFDDILWMAGFFGVLLMGWKMINADGDIALHLNLGKYIINTGSIPIRDVFSHTMTGEPVIQHEWLATVIFEGIKRLFGFDGVIFLCALLISTTIYLLYKYIKNKSQNLLPALLVTLLVLVISMIHWLARPHLFTFLIMTLWLIILDQLREGKGKRWWLLPLLMLLWVNLHGGFIIGFIIWIIYGFGAAWDIFFNRLGENETPPKRYWKYFMLGGSTSFIASLINPSGFILWTRVISHVGNRYLSDITNEFQSPNFHEVTFWPFLIFILFEFVILGLNRRKFKSEILFNSTAWLAMSLYSGRNIPLFGIASAQILALGLDDLVANSSPKVNIFQRIKSMDKRLNIMDFQLKGELWKILSILIVILGMSQGVRFEIEGKEYRFDPGVYPVDAVNWLEEHPQDGHMFNYFTWGGYLQYRLYPEKRVFIDSKSDFYGEEFVRQYMQVINLSEGWEYVLEEYHVNWVILPNDEPASRALIRDLGWKILYEDDTAVILKQQ